MQKLVRNNIQDDGQRRLKVLQFGGGNFLRAFTCWMVNRMNERCGYQGGVAIVKPTRAGNYDLLKAQEGLFHLVTKGYQKGQIIEEIDLITCVDKIVQPYEEFDDFIALASEPDLRIIVSNTTESGIVYDKEDPGSQPPENFPGKLCVFLKSRFDHFDAAPDKGCIILPCELIDANGSKLQEITVLKAREWNYGEAFIRWLQVSNYFCNTLVDRIVTGLPAPEKLKEYQEMIGFEDHQLVVGEPYHLWAIEGPDFLEKEFPLRQAGINAVITKDLSTYRLQKVRLLNGSHTAMVAVGLLSGIQTVGQFINDRVLLTFLQWLMREEIIPSIAGIEKFQLEAYANDVLDRFRNPFVEHKLSSIALNSISKFKVRILPSIWGYYHHAGHLPAGLVLSFAAMIRFYEGNWQDQKLPVNDGEIVMEILKSHWVNKRSGHLDWLNFSEVILSDIDLWGSDLTELQGLTQSLAVALQQIDEDRLMDQLESIYR